MKIISAVGSGGGFIKRKTYFVAFSRYIDSKLNFSMLECHIDQTTTVKTNPKKKVSNLWLVLEIRQKTVE